MAENPNDISSNRLARAKLRHATFIDPRTSLRSRRSFTLHSTENVLYRAATAGSLYLTTSVPGLSPIETVQTIPERPPTRWERIKSAAKERAQKYQEFATSDLGIGMLKCALAYLLGSMYTFIPFFNVLLDRVDSKHVAATITVYFHPARNRGSALKALVVAFSAFLYTTVLGLCSMGVSILFLDYLNQPVIGHTLVLILFVGCGLGFVGWVKLTHSDPLINIACSLTNLSLISVLTKEGAVQVGDLSFGKLGQYLRMIVAGVTASTLVALLVFPVSARTLFKRNMVKVTDVMSDMLGLITSSFISGDETELESKEFSSLESTQKKVANTLKSNLADSKIECNVRGFEAEGQIMSRMLECVQRINQTIGGLRSAAAMQFVVVKKPHNLSSLMNGTNPYGSINTSPAKTPNPERFGNRGWMSFDSQLEYDSSTTTMTDGGTGFDAFQNRYSKFRSTQEIFELFIDELGPSMRALAFTLKEILDDLPFDPEQNYVVTNNPRFRTSLERALSLYRDARKVALEKVYNKKNMDRSRPPEVEADWEESAACCGQFSYCLLSVAEHVKEYLVILDDFDAEVETRPLGRTWSWLKFWKKTPERKKSDQLDPIKGQRDEDDPTNDLANDYSIHAVKPKQNDYERGVRAGQIRMNLKQRIFRRIYDALSFLRREDKKFFIKVGFGAILYALPSYIPATRPIYTHWRGEWGLLSYMLVCSMTIGASNTTGWQRTWGTCLGAVLAIAAWHICAAKAVPLAVFGFIMAYITAYVILGMGKGPLGRFIMLTYNLSALYAYNLLIVPDGPSDEDKNSVPQIVTIALHRTVAVVSGCIWGLIVTRLVWPLSARRKLKDGLTLLWLRMSLIWSRDPLAVFTLGESQEHYMNLREETELQSFMSKLNSLVANSENEFVMRRPFPADTYKRILKICDRMLEAFHQMQIVIEKDMNASPGERALLEATARQRDQLCSRLAHQFSVLASSMKLEYCIANDAMPDTEHARDRLLAKVFTYRKEDAEKQNTTDEDYSVLYTYALVTGQVGREIKNCLKEVEALFGVLDEESLWLQ